MSESIKVQNTDNLVKIEMKISRGKFLSLVNSLREYNTTVGNGLLRMIENSIPDDLKRF
jgi:hypothetical protein